MPNEVHSLSRTHRGSPGIAFTYADAGSPSLVDADPYDSPAMHLQALPSAQVQVLGMNLAQTQSLHRTSSGTSASSNSHSGASTPYHHPDALSTRFQPAQSYTGFTSQRKSSQASTAETDHQAPLGRTLSQHEQDHSRYNTITPSSSRKAFMSHNTRVLAHKDSFGGLAFKSTGDDSADELVPEGSDSFYAKAPPRLAEQIHDSNLPRPPRVQTVTESSEQPKRSLSLRSSTSQNRRARQNERVEVLGQVLGRTHLHDEQLDQATAALSAAVEAATVHASSSSASIGNADSPSLSESHYISTSTNGRTSPRQTSGNDDPSHRSHHAEKLDESILAPKSNNKKSSQDAAPLPPKVSEKKDKQRDRRVDKTTSSSRSKGQSSSARTEAYEVTRPLKSSYRYLPQLPSAPNVKPAPPPAMYWSKVPVHGAVPRRSFRAHTTSLSDEMLWLFGGCDNKGCFREIWCFDTETMCWSKPKVTGDVPPARRAHTATMYNKRLFVFAGGDGPNYFNDLYVFDTVSLRWSKPEVFGTAPSPRRAHTCNYYEGQLVVFGGGNGVGALNDVHLLDVKNIHRLEWRKMDCSGKIPIGRGYHTTNLVDGKLIVIGGSDGHMSFNDIHILRLDTQTWYQVKTDETHNRLGHTATQVGSYLFIFGGHNSKAYTSELLTLNLVNLQWETRKVCGSKPHGRGYHQAWLRDSRLFVHGGFNGKDIFDDLHYLDLAACAYLPQITSFSVELDNN